MIYTPTYTCVVMYYFCVSVLLYVREQHETIFNALMLQIPSLHGLLMAVSECFSHKLVSGVDQLPFNINNISQYIITTMM